MAQPVPRLSIPAALALGSAALGAAFATGLLLGELGLAAAAPGVGGRGAEPESLFRTAGPDPAPSPRRKTVASVGVQAATAPAAT